MGRSRRVDPQLPAAPQPARRVAGQPDGDPQGHVALGARQPAVVPHGHQPGRRAEGQARARQARLALGRAQEDDARGGRRARARGRVHNGLEMQGARWDMNATSVEKSRPKEQFSQVPVMSVRGVLAEKADNKGVYMCPCYKTTMRIFNPDEKVVFCAQMKTKSPPGRWVMAGVALIMDPA